MPRRLAPIALLSILACGPCVAAVSFSSWSPSTVDEILSKAAGDDQLVMVVITQPDWCPACIHLDTTLLRNPEATGIEKLTRDWVVLEVLGYDAPGARFLAEQGLSFVGTPTTLLLKPGAGDRKLGDARQLAGIAGVPDDYLDRLRRAAEGQDEIAQAQAQVREANDTAAWLELARAYLEAGDAQAARRSYRSVLARQDLSADERRDISLEAIIQPTQRVEKDHVRALSELDAWIKAYPDQADNGDYVYARTWSLLALDRIAEARVLIDRYYIAPGTADDLATYLYLVFRHPSEALLPEAEARARAGIEAYPEQRGRLSAAHGRILRRMGRLEEAEAAFADAVEATDPSSSSYNTYVGQLDYVRRQLRERTGAG